jgi:antitoxin (DNA-binding transcriptional repressor) of toxin-antitoxin stability system
MKRYTVSQARERLAEVLDEAERGGSPVIERRDVRYVVTATKRRARARAAASVIAILDPALERGDWTWAWSPQGLRFKMRRSRS